MKNEEFATARRRIKNEEFATALIIVFLTQMTQISQILKKTKKTCDETRDKSRETIDKIMMEWYNEILKENQENPFLCGYGLSLLC